MARLIALLAAASLSCSLLSVPAPGPATPTRRPAPCASRGVLVLDGVVGVGALLTSALIGVAGSLPEGGDASAGVLPGVLVAVPFFISLGVGQSRINRCEAAHAAWDDASPEARAAAAAAAAQAAAAAEAAHTPAEWQAARAAGVLGKIGQWCRPPSSNLPACDEAMPCVAGVCQRTCRELSPGAEMWSCGAGFKCTPDRSGCVLVTR